MSHTVECPICFKNFSSDFVQAHAQKCRGHDENENVSPGRPIKIDGMPSAKKAKISKEQGFFSLQKQRPSGTPGKIKNIQLQKTKNTISTGFQFERKSARTKKDPSSSKGTPLAERSRPATVDEYVGQKQVMGDGCVLSELLKSNTVPSMILWGPPGCGKTSLAHVIAQKAKNDTENSLRFVKMSATSSAKADVQAAIEAAKNDRRMFKRRTILFIDEIHRFNKLQQDTFLPHVEDGTIVLIGATTENPSFSLNSALLSRCRVIVLEKLSSEEVKAILLRALKTFESDVKLVKSGDNDKEIEAAGNSSPASSPDCEVVESNNNVPLSISEEAVTTLADLCDGDARTALSGLQMAIQAGRVTKPGETEKACHINVESVKKSLHRSHVLYDRKGDQHYEIISAFQKSIRGCDDNATLYWLARMLEGGEDPRFISRRLIRIASEDVGIADPNALTLAVSTQKACEMIGMPECDVVLAECAVYMARAPKSVEVYMAYARAKDAVRNHEGPLPGVPLHLRNASTKLMKSLGYGKGYRYDSPAEQEYLPESLSHRNFFTGDIPHL